MINYHKELVSALNKVLPTYYEMALTKDTKTPCISYLEMTNSDTLTGDTIFYSRISYQIKVWANDIKTIQDNALKLDVVLRPLGFKRIASAELSDPNSSMIQKILTYEATGLETFTEV